MPTHESARTCWRKEAEAAIARVYEDLRGLADAAMLGERPEHTLQATALVNEACLRLLEQRVRWNDDEHVRAVASLLIRRTLADHARRRGAEKRGGSWKREDIPAELLDDGNLPGPVDLLLIDEALVELHELDARQARIVELRFFGGLSFEEIAANLSTSPRTVYGDWRMARAWLRHRLDPAGSV